MDYFPEYNISLQKKEKEKQEWSVFSDFRLLVFGIKWDK